MPWLIYDILIRQASHHMTVVNPVGGPSTPHSISYFPDMTFPTDTEGWTDGEFCEMREGEHALLELPTLTDPQRWEIEGNQVGYPASLGLLSDLPDASKLNGFWQYTPAVPPVANTSTLVHGKLQMLLSPRVASIAANTVEENAPGVGTMGGTCTCDDGQVYQVGSSDDCASLECIDGMSGACSPNNPGGAGVRVTCARSQHPFGTAAKPSCSQGVDCHRGQRCVGATLTRHECSPGGCNLDSNTCLGDVRVAVAAPPQMNASWCTASPGWEVPAANANVTIPSGTTVVIEGDCQTSLINKLDIFGTLRFVDPGTGANSGWLRARYIHVAAVTGVLEAGTVVHPFYGGVRISVYGNRMTPQYPNSGLGSKFIAVFGTISLVGAPRAPLAGEKLWTQLSYNVEGGQDYLNVPSTWAMHVGLRVGDTLGVASSGLVWNETEYATIRNMTHPSDEPTTRVYLTRPLTYDHTGLANATWLDTYDHPFLAAEVALLRAGDNRVMNIEIDGPYEGPEGATPEQFGVSMYILQRTASCPSAGGGQVAATATIMGIRMSMCGQRGVPDHKACIFVGPQGRDRYTQTMWDSSDANGNPTVRIQHNGIGGQGFNTGM